MTVEQVERALEILDREYKKWKAPVVTLISNRTRDPFRILISTVLSLRTKDEVTSSASERLFKIARTPYEMIKLSENELAKIIFPVGFYNVKARNILEISRILIEKYKGTVPDKLDELLKLPGVGRKTANLVLTEGYNKLGICVDTHVHRISNRWEFVKTKTPEQTEFELRKKLPKKWWIKYNKLLVAFGQTICKPIKPKCEECPLNYFCPKAGVKKE